MRNYIVFFILFACFSQLYSMENNKEENNRKLLHAAYGLKYNEVVALVEGGNVDLETKNVRGLTALFSAVKPHFYDGRYASEKEEEAQINIIKFLVQNGARTDVADERGNTMWYYANQPNCTYTLKALCTALEVLRGNKF